MLAAGTQNHRMGDAPLITQPALRLIRQFRDRMAREERGAHALARRLPRDGLGAVLAKLGRMTPAVRVRPGAARAIEPALLVHHRQTHRRPQWRMLGGE